MVTQRFSIRALAADELDVAGDILTASKTAQTFLPFRCAPADDRALVRHLAGLGSSFWLAEDELGAASVLGLDGGEVRMLYTLPGRMGQGAGTVLIEAARRGRDLLELWCFEANVRARRFYEHAGFVRVGITDGAENAERLPAVRYRWRRS